MDREHFEKQLKRLASTYGAQAYPPERVRIFWEHFQGVPSEVFERAVTALIANEQYAPMLPIVQKAVLDADDKILRPQFRRRRHDCAKCEDVGTTTTELPGGIRVAAPCDCPRGDAYRDAAIANANRPAAVKERHDDET